MIYHVDISSCVSYITTWNPKHPLFNGCFSWMIPNLYIENCCFTKHPLKHGCLGFQVYNVLYTRVINLKYHLTVNSTIFPSLMQWFVGGKKTIPNKDFLFYSYRGVIYMSMYTYTHNLYIIIFFPSRASTAHRKHLIESLFLGSNCFNHRNNSPTDRIWSQPPSVPREWR